MVTTPARHLEVERKLDAPAGFVLPELGGVAGVAAVADPVVHALDATYFDTEDLRLQQARLTLRRRTGGTDSGWHLKRPASRGARTEEQYPLGRATRAVPPALRAGVEVHARGAAIVPVVRLRTTRTVRTLLAPDGVALAEVAVDAVEASVPAAKGHWTPLTSWHEIEVELVDGTERQLAKVVKAIVKAGATVSDSPSKVARALAAAGRIPASESASESATGPTPGSAGAVVLTYLREQVAHLQVHDPLVRVDAEDAVHQMRVACRRLRSALTVYRPLLDREVTEPLREELAWLGEELGGARDAEVVRDHLRGLVEAEPADLVEGPVVERIVRTMDERYRAAHDEALVTLDSPRYFALLDGLDALVAAPPFTADAQGAAADVLLPLVRKTWKRTARLVEAADATDDPVEHDLLLHDVRKAAKRARYAGESLVAAFGKEAKAYGKQMAAVQEVLGEHQDSVVIRGYLTEISAAAHAAGESTFTYGRLHALEQVRGYRTERDFDGVWATAQNPVHRAWLGGARPAAAD